MLQTLFHIPCELFGLPVFGFGILLAVWAVGSAAWLAWLVRRQGFNADTGSIAQVLAVLGAAIAFVLPWLCDARGLPIRGYGTMMLLAVLSGLCLATYRARRAGVDPEMIFALAFWMILPGIVGARAVYVTEYWSQQYWPIYAEKGLKALIFAIVNVPGGGLVVFGAFFGGMFGLGLFWWRHRVPLLATADLIAPSLLLGLALGRVGCLLNGCCYGDRCDRWWQVTFPWNSPVHQHEAEKGVAGIFGLTFRDGPHGLPAIESIAPDSPAAQKGLSEGMENGIVEINGADIKDKKEGVTAKEWAAYAVLGSDKLNLKLSGSGLSSWSVDDPPEWQIQGSGSLKIYGLEIGADSDGRPEIGPVWWQSPEAAAGIHEGQRVEGVCGRKVRTIGELRRFLDEHRERPWLRIIPAIVQEPEAAWGSQHPEPRIRPDYDHPIILSLDRPLPRSPSVHPTQLYSTIDALILCSLLLCYDRFRRRDGELTALMLTIYPITRFLIEMLRKDEAPILGTGLHISQIIGLGLLPVAVCLWIYILRRPAKLAFGGG